MLSAILAGLSGTIVDSLLGRVTGVFESYFNKQITQAELKAKVQAAMLETFAEVEKANVEGISKTYESFMQAAKTSLLMQGVWAATVISQLLVLLWHQAGIPALVYMTGDKYPSSGSTVEWSYALIAACLGFGPMILRAGPGGTGNILTSLKNLFTGK
jgi:hypothetical protein